MPIYAIKTAAAWASDASLNGATFVEVADPGEVTGLTNGTAYQAREVVRSDLSAQFTPLAAASFSVAYAAGVTVAAPAADPSAGVVNVGDANANLRLVVTGHALLSGNTTNKLAGLTVNGGACTVHVQSGGLGSVNPISFIAMTNDTVPAGGNVTISADWTDGFGPNSGVAVRFEAFRVISSGAPTIAFTDTANNAALDLNVLAGDAIIAALTNPGSGNADPSGSWSNATHNSSVNLNGSGLWSSVASVLSVGADATGLAVGNTVSGRYAGLVLRAPA